MEITFVSALMLTPLLLLCARPMLLSNAADLPHMKLPVASHGKACIYGHAKADLSWTKRGGWVAAGFGAIGTGELESFLREEARKCEDLGMVAIMRVRIPGDAPAGHFVHFTRCMERAGVSELRIAVVCPLGKF